MIEEHEALLSSLEKQDMPLHVRRGMLNVLSRSIMFMSVDEFQRYQRLADAMEPTRKQIHGLTN